MTSSSILLLSDKYLIEDKTRQKALEHVRMAWPSTLKAWDLREDLARLYEVETGQLRGNRYPHPIVSATCCAVFSSSLIDSDCTDLSMSLAVPLLSITRP